MSTGYEKILTRYIRDMQKVNTTYQAGDARPSPEAAEHIFVYIMTYLGYTLRNCNLSGTVFLFF